jgi:hypothetical protein
MDPATRPLALARADLIDVLREGCPLDSMWEPGWAAAVLAQAGAERLSPAGLSALASARRCLDQVSQALRELERAQLALADALEAPQL